MSEQRGSVLVLTTLCSLALMGFAAMAVDVGRTVATRTRLQRVADSAALAGCKDLPNGQAQARAAALDFAGRNGIALTSSDVTFPDASSVRVRVDRPVNTVFARVLGIMQYPVPSAATAEVLAATRTKGLRPWGIAADDFQDYRTDITYGLKLGEGGGGGGGCHQHGGGNFHALALDGSGAASYGSTIINGSTQSYAVGGPVETEPGNMVGPTRQGVESLIGNDRHTSYAQALAAGDTDCPRLISMIVTRQASFGHGRNTLTVDGFATFFITGNDGGEVTGQFVRYVDMNATSDGTRAGNGTQAIALIN
jgi:hypothetical protein